MQLRPLTPDETALAAPLVEDIRYITGDGPFRCYVRQYADYDDAVAQAYLGVHRAAMTFDAARGVKFTTYAYWWIRNSLQRGLGKYGPSISPGVIQEPELDGGDGQRDGAFSQVADTRLDGKGCIRVDHLDEIGYAFQNLGGRQRSDLWKKFVWNMSYAEMGRERNRSKDSSRLRCDQALKMARRMVAGPDKGELFA